MSASIAAVSHGSSAPSRIRPLLRQRIAAAALLVGLAAIGVGAFAAGKAVGMQGQTPPPPLPRHAQAPAPATLSLEREAQMLARAVHAALALGETPKRVADLVPKFMPSLPSRSEKLGWVLEHGALRSYDVPEALCAQARGGRALKSEPGESGLYCFLGKKGLELAYKVEPIPAGARKFRPITVTLRNVGGVRLAQLAGAGKLVDECMPKGLKQAEPIYWDGRTALELTKCAVAWEWEHVTAEVRGIVIDDNASARLGLAVFSGGEDHSLCITVDTTARGYIVQPVPCASASDSAPAQGAR